MARTEGQLTPEEILIIGDLYPLGTPGQFPSVNNEGTGLEYKTLTGGGDMLKSDNLSGLADYAAARANLSVYSKSEVDTSLSGKQNSLGFTPEDTTNKKTTMTGNTTSNVFFLSAKAIYDWAISLFVQITDPRLSDSRTPSNDSNLVHKTGDETIGGDKTLTGTISGITKTMVGLSNVDNTSDSTKNNATATLTNKSLTTPIIASIKGAVVTDTDGATITFDKNAGDYHRVTLGGNRTIALSNMSTGDKIVLDLIQDATGGRTVTWFSTIKWVGGTAPTLTTTASKADTIGFICTSAGNYQGYVIGINI